MNYYLNLWYNLHFLFLFLLFLHISFYGNTEWRILFFSCFGFLFSQFLFLFKAFYIQGLLFFLLVIALSLLLAGRGKGWGGGVALYLLGCWTECGFGASATSLSYSQRELAVYLPLKYIECMENSHRRDYSTYRQTSTRGVRIPRTNVLWIFPYYRGHTSEIWHLM